MAKTVFGHHPGALKQKEVWLENMLRSHGNVCDVKAFLVVLRALASPDVQDAGAPRRAERWMNRLQNQQLSKDVPEIVRDTIEQVEFKDVRPKAKRF